jgi:ornithine decarboxylase
MVIDRQAVVDNLEALQTALPGIDLHFAYKALPDAVVADACIAAGASFDVASPVEIDEVVRAGADPAQLLYSHPIKYPKDIARAHAFGVRKYAFDSVAELDKIAAHAPGADVFVRLAVEHVDSVFTLSDKFGATPAQAVELLVDASTRGLSPHGIAFHVGSQSRNVLAWQKAMTLVGDVMHELMTLGIRLQTLNVGGGFPARYAEDVPPLKAIGATILHGACQLPYAVRLLAEPGRAVAADAGTTVTTVIGRATRRSGEWLYLDAGVYHGLIESLFDSDGVSYPAVAESGSNHDTPFTLAGPSCDGTDVITRSVLLPANIGIGDRVALRCTGAYSLSYLGRFCGIADPSVVHVG